MDDCTALLVLDGTVHAVLFRNEENGYTVLRLDVGGDELFTVVGHLPGVAPGEGLTVQGRWTAHAAYGPQFKAEVVERRAPAGEAAIFEYLASGAVRGIGAVTARRMVDQFGSDTLAVLEDDPQQLTALRGVTRKRAAAMGEAYRLQLGMRRLLDFLTAHDLPLTLAMPLHRQYGDRALEVLRRNPYLLAEGELGVGFSVADGLALSLGLADDSPQRLEAGLLFELAHNLGNGHAFLPRDKLLWATALLLDRDQAGLEDALTALLDRGEVVYDPVAGQEACYLAQLYADECYVAFRIGELIDAEFLPPQGLDHILARIEAAQGIAYAPLQRQVVDLAARRQMMLLTGGPGTGKTTSLRAVLALFDALGLTTALAAPTGRAAKRLAETCGAEASTIHRLLETRYDPVAGQLRFAHNEDDPLEVDAVIVDETSMVDISLMRALLAALPGGCRLILVGDPDQLPSVGAGNLLSDLLRSGTVPTVRLTEIFRQAAESAIIRSAHQINRGAPPDLAGPGEDLFFLRRSDYSRASETIVDLVARRLPQKMGIPTEQIQVLSPTRKGPLGTAALNRVLQQAVNPPAPDKGERRFGDVVFRTGDRVMQVKNNYDLAWTSDNGALGGLGVFNGDIGRVASIDPRGDGFTVDFEGRLVTYLPEQLGELEPAFAITVHKAQGSEYRAVVLALGDIPPPLRTRGVLYTAVTRAKSLLVLVGEESALGAMAANDRRRRRYSGLRARLAAET